MSVFDASSDVVEFKNDTARSKSCCLVPRYMATFAAMLRLPKTAERFGVADLIPVQYLYYALHQKLWDSEGG